MVKTGCINYIMHNGFSAKISDSKKDLVEIGSLILSVSIDKINQHSLL